MPNANTEPEVIFLDYVRDGQARLLVRWNITEVKTEERTSYNYSERVIWWTLPKPYATLADVIAYLDGIKTEILDWAKATDLTFDGTTSKSAAAKAAAKVTTATKKTG